MSNEGIVSLSLMDKLIAVDSRTGLVTVQAGARVQEVLLGSAHSSHSHQASHRIAGRTYA